MSSYTGLYVQRLSNGILHNVQVFDPFGNSIPLDPETYVARGIKPLIEQLPDEKTYFNATQKQTISPVILALADWVKGVKLSDEAFDRIQQFGFVHSDQNGNFQLTPSGKQALQENGLV